MTYHHHQTIMEIKEDGFLEELVGLTRETCTPTDEFNGLFSSTPDQAGVAWSGADFGNLHSSTANSSYESFSSSLDCSAFYPNHPLSVNPFTGPEGEYSVSLLDIPTTFNAGLCSIENNNSTKGKVKKVHGQPSKNLMAERRRRKRLNDRLAMLRSVVPKISKMDRTSILGDTIDYMKELLEKINNLQESDDVGSNQFNVLGIFKDAKPNDLVRNSPKFDVERRELDTRVEMCCAGKPGLLLSTVTTLEALGLEIQQCVISCFNDFSLQASCSQGSILGSEDIKQALFRNAGYGGRCL